MAATGVETAPMKPPRLLRGVGGGPVSWSGTVGPVTIVRLTRVAVPAGASGPRWRVILSDSTEALTETGAPVNFTITDPANAGR